MGENDITDIVPVQTPSWDLASLFVVSLQMAHCLRGSPDTFLILWKLRVGVMLELVL